MELFEFKFYKSYTETFNELSDEDCGKLMKRMYNFYFFGKDKKSGSPVVEAIFPQIKYTMKKSIDGKSTGGLHKAKNKKDPTRVPTTPPTTPPDTVPTTPPSTKDKDKDKVKEIYIGATRSEAIEELNKIIVYWNDIWKEERKVTDKLEEAYLKARRNYSKEDIKQSLGLYIKEKKDTERQYRLDPLRFFTQKNGFITYL